MVRDNITWMNISLFKWIIIKKKCFFFIDFVHYLQPYLLKSDWLKNVKLYNLFMFFSSNIYRNYRIDSNFLT